MFSKIRWRIAASYTFLLLFTLGGLFVFLARGNCVANTQCVWTAVTTASILLIISSTLLGLWLADRINHHLDEIAQVGKRIVSGDWNARILPQAQDEISDLAHTFNQTADHYRQTIAELTTYRNQYGTVMQHMADGVLIVNPLSHITFMNPAAFRLLRTTEEDALERPFATVARHHQLIELMQHCREEGREQITAVELDKELFLRAVITPFRQAGGQNYLVILQNLTQVRYLQTVRRDFVSNISHELRTPLASIRAIVETLQVGALDDPPAAERFLSRAEHEVDTLTQMVEELLELSRIESGQVPLRMVETAVSDLIQFPLERLQAQAERQQVKLEIDLPQGLPNVLADAGRVRQVVSNLLHNAIKFTPEKGKILIRAYVESNDPQRQPEVVIAIKDSGIGIDKFDLPRIFERFYKSDRARTQGEGGTGLGLAIARHIVQAHNGRIWAKSKVGKGSTFYFTLPLASSVSE